MLRLLPLLAACALAVELHVPAEPGAVVAAFDSILSLPPGEDVDVKLASGVHHVSAPIQLTSAHSRGRKIRVGAKSTTSDVPIISGGIPVTGTWEKEQASSTWSAPLPDGFDASDIGRRMQAWQNETRWTLARSSILTYENATGAYIVYKDGQILPKYYDQENVYLVLYESWTAALHKIKSIVPSNRTCFLSTAFNAQWASSASGFRFYVENALELLDSPGEFYVDAGRKRILVVSNEDPNQWATPMILAGPQELLFLNGTSEEPVSGVEWQGIAFSYSSVETETCFSGSCDGQSASFLTTATVHLRHAQEVTFTECSFTHTGGIAVWFDEGCFNNSVGFSTATDLGAGGVRIGTPSPSWTDLSLRNEGNAVHDCVLTDGGHVHQMGAGVLAQNVGNTTITHNEIGHFRYTGVSTGWTWGYAPTLVHDVHTTFNHIHDIGLGYLSDMGCVYTLGHQPGSIVDNNVCSDVQSYNYGGWAYYTDEGSRDEVFTNNVAFRTKCAGHHQHYGTDNLIVNNLYYDVNIGDVPTPGRPEVLMTSCDSAIRASTHHRTWECHPDTAPTTGCCCHPGCDQGKCSSFTFKSNVVAQPVDYSNGTLVATTFSLGLLNFTFEDNLYYSVSEAPSLPLFNVSEPNEGYSFQEWKDSGKDVKSQYADPELDTSNFTLAPSSPAFSLGYKQIDISTVGPRAARVGAPDALHQMAPSGLEAVSSELRASGLVL